MSAAKANTPPLDQKAILYMALLALQFGVQPSLVRRFTPPGICKSSVILVQEVTKFLLAALALHLSGNRQRAMKDWSLSAWLAVAGVPAALYAVQNLAALLAYQHLDGLTFNVLNQTKTLSAAVCCYIVMGRKQSFMQVVSLFLLMLSALVMERLIRLDYFWNEPTVLLKSWGPKHYSHGVAPILLASFISGLAGALSQKNLQSAGGGRNSYLFSMELCAATTLILLGSLTISQDGQQILEKGFFHGWTLGTYVPILINSVGGIIVGLVTKYAGTVRKGFALMFGIFLSGLLQEILSPDTGVSKEQLLGGFLATVSLWIHATHPYVSPPTAEARHAKQE